MTSMEIHHIGYLIKQMDPAIDEFTGLGYEVESEPVLDDVRKAHIAFVVMGDYRVELICPTSKESPIYPLLTRYRNAPYHICYYTDELESDIERLSDEGYVLIDEPEIAPAIAPGGKRVAFMMSNKIGMLELLER